MRTQVYYNDALAADISARCNATYRRSSLPAARVVEGGIITHVNYGPFYQGVLTPAAEFVPLSGEHSDPQQDFATLLAECGELPYRDETAVYLGMWQTHYGHFLLETCARLWYWLSERCEDNPELVPVFALSRGATAPVELPAYAKEFFALIGMDPARFRFVNTPTRFKRVIAPPLALTRVDLSFADQYLIPFRRAAAAIPPAPHEKVYLNRLSFKGYSACIGEEELEKAFVANGFYSVSPETLPLREQIALMKGAKVIAGPSGTALHNSIWNERGAEVIVLGRSGAIDQQFMLNELTHSQGYLVQAYLTPMPCFWPGIAPALMGITPWVCRFFDDKGWQLPARRFEAAAYFHRWMEAYEHFLLLPKFETNRRSTQLTYADLAHYEHLRQRYSASPARAFWLRLLYHLAWGSRRRKLKAAYRALRARLAYPIFREQDLPLPPPIIVIRLIISKLLQLSRFIYPQHPVCRAELSTPGIAVIN